MQPENTGTKTWQWVVTVIVIIVLIIIGIMVFGNKSSQTTMTGTDNGGSMASTTDMSGGRIVMSDQYPGNVVYLSSVQMDAPGWVVIAADNGGQPGAVIGSAAAPSGINPVKVTLTSPMIDGGTYYAILYSSNGASAFDATADQPITDSTGAIIMHVFHASSSVGASLKG